MKREVELYLWNLFLFFAHLHFFLIVSWLRIRLIKPKKVRPTVVTVPLTSKEVRACGCTKSSAWGEGKIWVSVEYGASFGTTQNSNWVTFSSSTRLVWRGVNGTVWGQTWRIVDMSFVIGKSFFVEKSNNRVLFTLLRDRIYWSCTESYIHAYYVEYYINCKKIIFAKFPKINIIYIFD